MKIENYLWMTLKLNNDTSVINACVNITYLFQGFVELAEPNYCGILNSKPTDEFYDDKQKSLQFQQLDVERAWEFQPKKIKGGSSKIKVGIIDDGIQYSHCDLGGLRGVNFKVIGGWNYQDKNNRFGDSAMHGTNVAGVIGAFTNRSSPDMMCTHTGIAGIAGGWLNDSINNIGSRLYGYKINIRNNDTISIGNVISAIRDAVTKNDNSEFGIPGSWGNDIINCSWGYEATTQYMEGLREALNYAYEHGVSIVTSRGNTPKDSGISQMNAIQYPACFDPSWITSVGGHEPNNDSPLPMKNSDSRYGHDMDFLAPAYTESGSPQIYTTMFDSRQTEYYSTFSMTSAAAAHISGSIALLRSDFSLDSLPANPDRIKLEPEDFENMLKASAIDLNYNNKTLIGYDSLTGWGQAKLGNLYDMLYNGYIIKHYSKTIPIEDLKPFPDTVIRVAVRKQGIREDCDPITYLMKKRIVQSEFRFDNEIPDKWITDGSHNLYVWGRNGRTKRGGLSAANPLFLTSYTEVRLNDTYDRDGKILRLGAGNGIVPGIIHNDSSSINAVTYQYQIVNQDSSRIRELPNNEDLELYITIFGVPKKDPNFFAENSAPQLLVTYPNPAVNQIQISYAIDISCSPTIKIYNAFGNLIFENKLEYQLPNIYNKSIDISDLPIGAYIIELKQNSCSSFNRFLHIN